MRNAVHIVQSCWRLAAAVCALIGLPGGCVTTSEPATVSKPVCEVAPEQPSGDWLIGTWQHPFTTLSITRDGANLAYRWERVAGLKTEKWGLKAPAEARGQVVRVDGCFAEMQGAYTWSSTPAIIGREMILRLNLTAPGELKGQWYGAGYTWLDSAWRKAP